MGKRERNRKLKKEQERESQKLVPPTWKDKLKTKPIWFQFMYRFAVTFAILLPIGLIAVWIVSATVYKDSNKSNKNTMITMSTSLGDIKIQLYDKDAPKTVDNFIKLAKKGYYDGLLFHRVIKDFMIQAGDPNCNNPTESKQCGAGGESAWGEKFDDEINAKSLGLSADEIKSLEDQGYKYRGDLTSHKVEVGSIAMANAGPNTNGSQFFIVTQKPQPHLNGKHTVFGMVEEGMEVVSAIAAVKVDENDKPVEDVKIKSVKISN